MLRTSSSRLKADSAAMMVRIARWARPKGSGSSHSSTRAPPALSVSDVFPELLSGVLLGLLPDGGLDGRQDAEAPERAQLAGASFASPPAREAARKAASSTLRVKMPGWSRVWLKVRAPSMGISALGRLEAHDPAIGGGPDDRAVGLRAQGGRDETRRDRRGRAARRSARRMERIPGIAGLPGEEKGAFGGDGLPHDEGPLRLEQFDRPGRPGRDMAGKGGGAHLRGNAGGGIDVLHPQGNPLEGTGRPAGAKIVVGKAGGLDRLRRLEPGPGPDPLVERRDPRQGGPACTLRM